MSGAGTSGNVPPPGGILCPHCGTRNPFGSYFCNRCGTALVSDMEPAPSDPAAPLHGGDLGGFAEPGSFAGEDDATLFPGRGEDSPAARPPTGPISNVTPEQGQVEAVDESGLEEQLSYFPPESQPIPPETPPQDLVTFPDEQLLGAGQGYLESVAISGEVTTSAQSERAISGVGDSDHWRALRGLMRDEPLLATSASTATPQVASYRIGWITLLILAAALFPFLAAGGAPLGAPLMWPGVEEAHDFVEQLQMDDEVLIFWQYDPATAGELDNVALPVISHLLERRVRSIVVTTLPTGLASARALYAKAIAGLDAGAMETVLQGWVGDGIFLSGGATALPLVGQDPEKVLSFAPDDTPRPRAAILFAARAEDAQQWIELVQPRNGVPAVAVTAAGADPLLRPYLQSRQLAGLVSGFDGAASYQSLRGEPLSADATRRMARIVGAQNWGALALFLILLVGNLVPLFGRDRRG